MDGECVPTVVVLSGVRVCTCPVWMCMRFDRLHPRGRLEGGMLTITAMWRCFHTMRRLLLMFTDIFMSHAMTEEFDVA